MRLLRQTFRRLAVILAVAVAFLLPLKYGGVSAIPEVPGFYPPYLFDWLIVTWPVTIFPVVSGAALLLALAGGDCRLPSRASGAPLVVLLWGVGVPLAALWGSRNSAVMDYAYAQCAHYAGIGAWCWCVALLSARDPGVVKKLFAALMWGAFVSVLAGWHQYFWGFEATRRYFAEAAANGAAEVGEQLQIKLNDDRVYSTFASCNSFAGFLILAGGALTKKITVKASAFSKAAVEKIEGAGGKAEVV